MSTIDFLYPSDELYPGDAVWPGFGTLPDLVIRAVPVVQHLLTGDDENDVRLAALVEALLYAGERLGEAAWAAPGRPLMAMLDPEVCAFWALPYAAQLVRATVPGQNVGESDTAYEARARDAVLHPPSRAAGSERALRDAARPFLTGTRAVKVVDDVGDEFHLQVSVRSDEVVDAVALEAAIDDDEILMAGLKPELVLVAPGSPWTIAEMLDVYSGRPGSELVADFPTIADLIANPGGL